MYGDYEYGAVEYAGILSGVATTQYAEIAHLTSALRKSVSLTSALEPSVSKTTTLDVEEI